ncbi:MAG: nitrous oxide-stimulated promoter family protein [Anaerolineae bacterium]|nr:nitrous oxide-stimulated promoter family protein [Anaerolineae bacterium]
MCFSRCSRCPLRQKRAPTLKRETAESPIDRRGERVTSAAHPRMKREDKTVEAMIRMHCGDRHGGGADLCDECEALLDYARQRLGKCPFQENKTACARCPVHCYRPDMREEVRAVMRYAGPRMLYRHPVLAVLHLLDGLRRSPR